MFKDPYVDMLRMLLAKALFVKIRRILKLLCSLIWQDWLTQ